MPQLPPPSRWPGTTPCSGSSCSRGSAVFWEQLNKHSKLNKPLLPPPVLVSPPASICSNSKWRSTTGNLVLTKMRFDETNLSHPRAARDRELKVRTLEEAARQAGQR